MGVMLGERGLQDGEGFFGLPAIQVVDEAQQIYDLSVCDRVH